MADLAAGAGAQLQRIVNRQRYREARVAEAFAAEQVSPSPSPSPGANDGDGRDSRPSVLTTEGMFGSSASVQRNKAMYREEFDRKPGYYNVQDYGTAMAAYDYWYDRISKIEARVDTQIDREMGGILLTGPVGGALVTGIVLAAPAVQGFVYANALRIRVAGDLTADFFAGTQVSMHIPATIGGATASLAVAERTAVDLSLTYKPGWLVAQRAEADLKVQILTEGDTVVSSALRSGTSAASRYRRAGNDIPVGNDVDHAIDLQLGGSDTVSNMWPLDSSVNRSLGSQIQQRIKNLPLGTVVNRVTIGDR